eukprot:TRINITY_DN687_c0_g2_i1.p1 TRINITY_DN687_c0_g2~~TRINITY_DN687_c0_g2_i1.p1  ORF type:complete len:742 (-),score=175.96 TRINITY_DN687_c0_g2_i1:65-2290(-)
MAGLEHMSTETISSPTIGIKRKIDELENVSRPISPSKKRCNSISTLQLSPLHVLALKGNIEEVIKIVKEGKIDVCTVDALGNSALHIAAGGGSDQCCKALLDLGAQKNLGNRNGLTPIHLAIRHNQTQCFVVLLEAGVDLCVGNVDGITPLHLAAKYGRYEMLKCLISKVQTLDFTDSWGQTPLHYTVLQKELECARLLLENGAKLPKDNIGMTPSLSAASVGATKCIQLLMSYGGSLSDKSRSGKTAVHFASQKGHLDCLQMILNLNKKDLNEKDRTGFTPLMEAKAAGYTNCVELLKSYGAEDINPDPEDLKCAVCHDMYFRSITIACGHTFCRACLQAWRKSNDSCPQCREAVRLVEGYSHNYRLDNLVSQLFPGQSVQRIKEQKGNSMECTIQNMVMFGKALGREVTLDKNHSCILAIDNEFPMHLTFLPRKNQLFIYAPILTQFPKDHLVLQQMYFSLLNESFLGNGFAGGGIGVILEKELVVFHCELDMCYAPPHTLKQTSVLFVEVVKSWRQKMQDMLKEWTLKSNCGYLLLHNSFTSSSSSTSISISTPSTSSIFPVTNKKFLSVGDKAGIGVAWKNIVAFAKDLTPKDQNIQTILTDLHPVYKFDVAGKNEGDNYEIKLFYDADTDLINVYASVMDDVPDSMGGLYEKLLQGSVFGFKSLHGGFGFYDEDGKKKLMIYAKLKMKRMENIDCDGDDEDPPFSDTVLKDFMPTFLSQIEFWKHTASLYVTPKSL